MKPYSIIMRILGGQIAPMVYIMMFVNVLIGFFFCTGLLINNMESVLYASGVLINRTVWGASLLLSSSLSLVGMIMKKDWLIRIFGFMGAILWIFASVAVAATGHWYVLLTIGLFHMSFHFYVYLASALGILYRAPVSLDTPRFDVVE